MALKRFLIFFGRIRMVSPILYGLGCVVLLLTFIDGIIYGLQSGLGCIPLVLVAAIIILRIMISRKVGDIAGGLIFPDEKFERPLPRYGPAQALRKQRRFKEAMSAYQKIAEEYPDEIRPYLEMMEIAMIELNDRSRARLIHQEGMEKLTAEEDREQLTRYLSRLCGSSR